MKFDATIMGSLTCELAAILREETVILKEMRIADVKDLLVRKQELAMAIEKQRDLLIENPALIAGITAEERQSLRDIAADYDIAMVGYQKELFKAQRVNAAIIEKMAEYVRDHVQQKRGYNKSGSQNLSGTELARNTPAIKFNESI